MLAYLIATTLPANHSVTSTLLDKAIGYYQQFENTLRDDSLISRKSLNVLQAHYVNSLRQKVCA